MSSSFEDIVAEMAASFLEIAISMQALVKINDITVFSATASKAVEMVVRKNLEAGSVFVMERA
jgi:hypothetical protein